MKLIANVRFLNVYQGNQIFDKDQEFEAQSQAEFDYLVEYKVARKPKSEPKKEESQPKSDKKK